MGTSPAKDSVPPLKLGRYRVLGHLATGGMAEILLAKLEGPAGFEKLVVLKRVLPHLARKSEFRRMFVDEARIVASLRHPNIVQVTELSKDGDDLLLAMEYLEGESLQRVLKRLKSEGRTLDYALAAHVLAAACAGLHAAHEHTDAQGNPQHLVHRDVSPQNLFITYDGAVKVLDFGVAKAADRMTNTSTGQVKGKFGYMSPEQALALELDRRTDVFALGIVLWEASTGQRLFQRDNELLVFRAICEEAVPPPSSVDPRYPPALEAIVMRALARKREDRYASAAEMRRDLLAVARELGRDAVLEDELAREMRELFADRIAHKRELARQVDRGEEPGSLSWLDASTDTAAEESEPDPPKSGLRTPSAPTALPARSRAPMLIAVASVLLAMIAGALVVLLAARDGGDERSQATRAPEVPPRASASEPSATETVAPPVAPDPPAVAAPDSPAPPSTITIRLTSAPEGAAVFVNDEARGTTPLELELPRGEEAVALRVELEGYRPYAEAITPDVEQRLSVVLQRERRRRPTSHGSAAGGFERFD